MAGVPAERPRRAELDWTDSDAALSTSTIGSRGGVDLAEVRRSPTLLGDRWVLWTIGDDSWHGSHESEAQAQHVAEEEVAEWFERIDVGDLRADRL